MAAILKSAEKGGGGPTYKALTSRLLISGVPWTKWYHSWRILGGGGGARRPLWAHGLIHWPVNLWHHYVITCAMIVINNSPRREYIDNFMDTRPEIVQYAGSATQHEANAKGYSNHQLVLKFTESDKPLNYSQQINTYMHVYSANPVRWGWRPIEIGDRSNGVIVVIKEYASRMY